MLVSVPEVLGAGAVPPSKPSNSRPGPTLLAFAIPSSVPRSPMLGLKLAPVTIVIQEAPKRASFNMLGLRVWVHVPTALCSGILVNVFPRISSELLRGSFWYAWE
jgi:hypothetical protein